MVIKNKRVKLAAVVQSPAKSRIKCLNPHHRYSDNKSN